jgi:hypothetical protein
VSLMATKRPVIPKPWIGPADSRRDRHIESFGRDIPL